MLGALWAAGLVMPFPLVSWDGVDRYREGVGLAEAPVGDAVRMLTGVVQTERFCEGALAGSFEDGTMPAALTRVRRWYDRRP